MYTLNNRINLLKNINFSKFTKNLIGNILIPMLPIELFDRHDYQQDIPFHLRMAIIKMLSFIPKDPNSSNKHFITVDSKFMGQDSALRREGIHLDGNFCGDPEFQKKGNLCWGGSETTGWGGSRCELVTDGRYEVKTPWVSEFGTKMEIGEYISSTKGGILCLSDYSGCTAFELNNKVVNIKSGGELIPSEIFMGASKIKEFVKDAIYFMTSDTPHESHIIPAGNRRTLIRITLAHDYDNSLIK